MISKGHTKPSIMCGPCLDPDSKKNNYKKVSFETFKEIQGFPCGSVGKESACNAGDLGSVPELGRSWGEGKGYPLQYSGLENSMGSQRVRHN